jgi:hypothetical protein
MFPEDAHNKQMYSKLRRKTWKEQDIWKTEAQLGEVGCIIYLELAELWYNGVGWIRLAHAGYNEHSNEPWCSKECEEFFF